MSELKQSKMVFWIAGVFYIFLFSISFFIDLKMEYAFPKVTVWILLLPAISYFKYREDWKDYILFILLPILIPVGIILTIMSHGSIFLILSIIFLPIYFFLLFSGIYKKGGMIAISIGKMLILLFIFCMEYILVV